MTWAVAVYRIVFWTGYVTILILALVPLKKNLHSLTVNVISFDFHLDQVIHTLIYLFLCVYYAAGQWYGIGLSGKRSLKFFFLAVFLNAVLSEFLQLFIPLRAFNIFDLLANLLGISLGALIIFIAQKMRSLEHKKL